MSASSQSQAPPRTLLAGSLNLPRLAFIGLAYFSLAPAIYLNMGFMETDSNGPVMPILFAVITIAVIPTAISFALLNNRRPSAGSGYTWLSEFVHPALGLWTGFVLITTYVVVCSIYPPAFGLFFDTFLNALGAKSGLWTGIAGGILMVIIGGVIAYRRIRLGAQIIGILMCFEAGFVALLALIIVIKGGTLGHFSSTPFNPAAAKAGFTGLSLAAIFAFLSIAGVDSIAPVAEEAHTPKRLVPLGTILITLIAGAYWTLTSYGYAISVPVKTVAGYVNAGQLTPVYPIAHQFIGGFDILVPITGFTAVIASFGASLYAASRLMYAVSRQGFLPEYLSRLHRKHHTPWNAELTTLIASLALFLLGVLWQTTVGGSFAYLAEIFVFFVLVAYMLVNVANIVYHARRPSEFNWFLNGLIPVLGIGIDGYILYRGFFSAELSLPFRTGSSIVWFSLIWAAIGVAWTLWWASRRNLREVASVEQIAEAVQTPAETENGE
jgi:amino acid transporter